MRRVSSLPGRVLAALTLAAALTVWVSPARAQPATGPIDRIEDLKPPSPPANAVTLPVVKKNDGVAYPKQAIDEGFLQTVQVAVLLDIDATGAVTKATVESPVGHGMDEAATAAGMALGFDPATRGGRPVAVRNVRFLFTFTPPPGALSGRVLSQANDKPLAGATVTVRDGSGAERTATTDADGAWKIDSLAAGTYHVTIRAPGRQVHEVDEPVGLAEVVNFVDRLAPESALPVPVVATADGGVEEVEEVEVRGEKPPREVTKRTLEQREINRIPGTNGDALRSLQNLPGVGRPPGLAGLLIVRGSAPQDSQYFVDGTPVPIVYHFGGLSSVVPTEMLNRLDFFPGNFSAQYGRAMGGVVDVGLISPSTKLHGMAEVDLLDSRVLAQGPLFDTGWRFAIAGRRSYLDVWLGPLLKSLQSSVSVSPVYYDYQAILERDLDKHSTLRFAFFGSDDKLAILNQNASASEPELAGSLNTHTGFWRAQAIYKNRFSENTEFKIVGAIGHDVISLSAGNLFFNLDDYPITARVELSQKLAEPLTMNVGLDLIEAPYTATAHLPPFPKPGQPPSGPFSQQTPLTTSVNSAVTQPATYVEWEATPWRGARIVPGIRLDYSNNTGSWDFDPRIVVRQDVASSPRTTLKGGVGLFSQPPQEQETNAVFGTPGLVDQRAIQYDVGVEHEFTRNIDASLEGFYKQLDHLVTDGIGSTGTGVIYGGETLIRYKPDARFFGWLAYTISRSLRRDAPGMPLVLSQFDETHILTVLGSYRLGRGWELGARYRLTSGYMYTPASYGFYDENIGTYLAQQAYPQFGSRLPLFQSLDLRVDKTWKFGWGQIGAYLDVLNVFNNGNVDGISYNFNATRTAYVGDLPFLPSLGIRVEF
ncbi:MAG TPA: carboxypeptidase regulatory-like domain-containing protein [Polyangiaceae bacterium]|jgi:TonB family protein|nr:carboxypeptidase regulatory-like domain-containing protein [Polyangiaceae bacterium]